VGASPARLVIALSVAAALAIFVVYTAIAGAGVAQFTPSTVAKAKGHVSLVGAVVGKVDVTSSGLRFLVRDIGDSKAARVLVVYSGTVPDLFRTGRHIVVDGRMNHGVFAATPGSLTTKCPSKYQGSSSKA
jgi:cytochrome c-type biogenesis protein CcmE